MTNKKEDDAGWDDPLADPPDGIMRPKTLYLLRCYERIAHTEHWCDRCCGYIYPGDMYEGRVIVYTTPRRHLVEWKTHLVCDDPFEPEEDDWKEWSDDEDVDLPAAA